MRIQHLYLMLLLIGCASVKKTSLESQHTSLKRSQSTSITNRKYYGPCKITEENAGRFYEGFNYDKKNRLKKTWSTDGGSYCTHFYDSNNKLKRVEVGLPLQRVETYFYGENGLLLEKQDRSLGHSQITVYRYEYKLNVSNRVIEKIETENFFENESDENPKAVFKTKVVFRYLENGKIDTELHYSLDTSDLILEVRYEYDSFGNIIFAQKEFPGSGRNYLLKYWYDCWEN